MTSVVGKVFERLLLSRLLNFIRLSPLQGGFRAGQSSLHTAFVFQETVTYLQECGHKAYVAFLDARKAFDTVWHEGLFVKLHRAGIPHSLWFLLVSWYRQCTSSVVWGNSCSRSFSLNQGVHQGAVLSPLLYSLFVDDLLLELTASGYGAFVDGLYCGALMYADDLVLIAASQSDLRPCWILQLLMPLAGIIHLMQLSLLCWFLVSLIVLVLHFVHSVTGPWVPKLLLSVMK